MTYALLLRGGRVIDPSQKLDAVTDVAFENGKVARVGPALKGDAGTDVRDMAGPILTPRLIHLHTPFYWGGTPPRLHAQALRPHSWVPPPLYSPSPAPLTF